MEEAKKKRQRKLKKSFDKGGMFQNLISGEV